ncbi:MerR family transcriptional regulator [Vulgatibacter incomptus]|uniref:Transcriptional regulator, MerR family n=1 Tax=Vulgatibacter incomptus TaxID=1391653 RepID=A0A0K1PEA1_9BACT|nr:MerR family transcriptional regulator [Vulgatibacter incomptus]AKU91731.1 Transcriptional regulator, MerR family [Vulgatibacter incomptus]
METDTSIPSEATLSTGDLARRSGTTLRTVRFYEEAGLLEPSVVGKGGRRLYTEGDLERLTLIADLRELDLSIEEIRELLRMREGCTSAPELSERFGSALAEQLDRTQRRLAALHRLSAEFDAALRALGSCRSCSTPVPAHACPSCDVLSRSETPRIMKVVVGGPSVPPASSGGDD